MQSQGIDRYRSLCYVTIEDSRRTGCRWRGPLENAGCEGGERRDKEWPTPFSALVLYAKPAGTEALTAKSELLERCIQVARMEPSSS